VLGPLRASVAAETGLNAAPVIAPASHDTASAVAAVPASAAAWAYISSGTWSLMGVELPKPLLNEAAMTYNFTNEGGVGGTVRFLKNIMGLWLVQECRRAWERGGKAYSYEDLTKLAEAAPAFVSLIDPDDGSCCRRACRSPLAISANAPGSPIPPMPAQRCAVRWRVWLFVTGASSSAWKS
jgi:rhamnulokinase